MLLSFSTYHVHFFNFFLLLLLFSSVGHYSLENTATCKNCPSCFSGYRACFLSYHLHVALRKTGYQHHNCLAPTTLKWNEASMTGLRMKKSSGKSKSSKKQYWSIFSAVFTLKEQLCSKTTFIYVCFTFMVITDLEIITNLSGLITVNSSKY